MTSLVTEPGVYDMPEDIYHKDPVPGGSLSVSGAKKLLPPSCPAIYDYERGHPKPPTRALDLGTAAHKLVLGAGWPFVLIDAGDYRTKKAQQARDEAHASGATPILNPEYEQIQAMAAAIRAHPLAEALLTSGDVAVEQSMFWCDFDFGVWRRGRADALARTKSGRLIVNDYKSAGSAEPGKFARAAYDLRYHMQADWYLSAVAACLGEVDAEFLFIAQEKTPPYLVGVYGLDDDMLSAGRAANERALRIYADCAESGRWPGYGDDITYLALPGWARYREETL